MITVYYADWRPFLQEDIFYRQLDMVESARKEKILRISGKEEKMRSLAAGSILHYALCEELNLPLHTKEAFQVEYAEGGKPFLKEYTDTYFNLSHSGKYVCCGVGREPVGVDVQRQTEFKEKLALRFFTERDNRMLMECGHEEQKELFFRMWSIKESYIKLTGEGMRKGLASYEIDWSRGAVLEKEKEAPAAFFYEKRDVPEYSFSVCLRNPEQEICWREVTEKYFREV